MSGIANWQAQIRIDIEDLKKRIKVAEGEINNFTNEDRKVKLNIDTKTLESAIQKLDKMLDSLGKGTGDFKQFENLSKELSDIVSEVQSLSKAFGKVDDSGAKTLLSSIQNIDKSLSELSQNILNVNKNMSNMGGNTSGAVKQVENITDASKKATSALEDVAKAQEKVNGQKTNISSENATPPSPPKKDRYAKRRKISEEDFLNYSPNRVNEKLSNSGYTILGETVNTELVDGLVKVSAKIKDADGAWKSFSAKVDADGNIFEQRFKTVTNGVDKLETALQNFGRETAPALTYQETLDKAQKIKNSLNLGDEYSIKVDSSEFVTITKKLTDVENAGASVTQTFKSAQDAIDNFGKAASNSAEKTSVALKSVKSKDMKDAFPDKDISASVESAISSIKEENNALEQNTQKVKENTQAKEQNANVSLNKYDKRLDSYQSKSDKYDAALTKLQNNGWASHSYSKNVEQLKQTVDDYKNALNGLKSKPDLVTEKDLNNLNELEAKIKDAIAAITNMSAAEKGFDKTKAEKMLKNINAILEKNSKMSSDAKKKIQVYYDEIASGNPSKNLNVIYGEVLKIVNAEEQAGRSGKRFLDIFSSSRIHQIASQMAGMFSFYDLINGVKQVSSTVIDLNTQITDLSKVSEATASQVYDDFSSYADIAKDIGGTISDTISATADWSRNGYNLPDSKELARVALLYKNVGDGIDIDTANESLISTLRGFKMEADEAEKIIDIFNNVSNNEPIDSGGIGEALQRSAASFNAANTSLQESVALISTTNSVIQNPEKVGNMWKVVSMRIRSATSELEEAGEDTDGIVNSTADLQKMIKAMTGYDILEKDGETFKSIFDIVLNISKVWNNLSDLDQSALLQALAGKQQSNALAAALNNPELLEKSYKEAMESAGSAAEEQSKYQESIQYSIDQTRAKLEELSNDLLSSEFLKGAIDEGGKLIDILDGIIKSGNAIPTLLTGIGTALSVNDLG